MSREDPDLTRALDGWRPDRGPRPSDHELRSLLDGWRPGSGPALRPTAPAAPDLALDFVATPPRDGAPEALDALGRRVSRGAARWAAAEITDVELDWQPAPTVAPVPSHPRLLAGWQPGAWLVAEREVSPARTELRDGPHGPVVEVFPALRLAAWWPPADDAAPLPRWPWRAALLAVEPESLPAALVGALPGDAPVHRIPPALVDWALVGQLVRLHETGLPAHQFEALQQFVDAEREAQFRRLNDDYHRPAPGAAVEQRR